jgi:hypothetical protein
LRRAVGGEKFNSIAKAFGRNPSTVSQVVNSMIWENIPPELEKPWLVPSGELRRIYGPAVLQKLTSGA